MIALKPMAVATLFAAATIAVFYALFLPVNQFQAELATKIASVSKDVEDLETRVRSLKASEDGVAFPPELLWHAASRSEASLALQDSLLQLAKSHQLSILTFGATELSKKTEQSTAAVTLEGESTLENFYQFLNAVENLTPRAAPALVRLRPRSIATSENEGTGVYFQTTIWAFWGDEK
ncbi:hypothetical protein [Leisingera sp. ANG-M7]|uniref:hypothetical protein n=1 Tax=Leisingera sp. ANG-M7 TaxID=1577902 RepID=UPI00057ECB7D|nr:hypothetical protein [Leisingera sp. ANG-M7]KIC34974.1 hypothetical protein RA26_20015 [Leisingera sp. ANG-M7]